MDSHIVQPFKSSDENRMGSLAEDKTLAEHRHHLPENQQEGKILPLQTRSCPLKAKVRELINRIRSLTFLVDDTKAMNTLYLTLKDAMEEF